MIGRASRSGRSAGLFLLGCVLLSTPVLALFNYKILVLGIPLLFLYIFSAWLVLIILIIGVTRSGRRSARPGPSLEAIDSETS